MADHFVCAGFLLKTANRTHSRTKHSCEIQTQAGSTRRSRIRRHSGRGAPGQETNEAREAALPGNFKKYLDKPE
jgi:hypothetical protein